MAKIDLGKVVGEQGKQGEQGIQGEQGLSGVYVGTGDMPQGYNVQIDPTGGIVVLSAKEITKVAYELLVSSGTIDANQIYLVVEG